MPAGLQQVQEVLERTLGTRPMPLHFAFWRGKTRDELVATQLFDLALIVPRRPEQSHLLSALRANAQSAPHRSAHDGGHRLLHSYFAQARANAGDLELLESWIRDGCPETSVVPRPHALAADDSTTANELTGSDDRHVEYWRAIDDFFLPSLASSQTIPHVLQMHGEAFEAWRPSMLTQEDPAAWPAYLARTDVAESFKYIRLHQRRLIREYYGDPQASLFDSLWKFGGNLLPTDPQSHARPKHTMNGVLDWFMWVPYLDASLRAADAEALDHDLARAWQIGIVADGLLRTDGDRPQGGRMPISDFNATDPELRSKVVAKYQAADAATLTSEMVRRARESNQV